MTRIYLDNNATTQVAPEVLEAMLPHLRDGFGNPSSLHRLGVAAGRALTAAREEVARILRCESAEVVFTSGGTEANNLALQGVAHALHRRGKHIVTTTVEHPSVEAVCQGLEQQGFEVTRLPVSPEGLAVADVLDAIRDDTILVSVMHVQNETGAIYPVEAIARQAKARSKKLLVHSDGVQACGKLLAPGPEVDLYTVSAHKIHGPQGAGALRVGRKVRLEPVLLGGGQERGLRSGTEPLPAIVGLGAAARLAREQRSAFAAQAKRQATRLREGVQALGGLLSSPADGVPSTLNVSFPGAPAEPLLHLLEDAGVFVSTGSACASGKGKKSPVLQALGLSDERVASALRISLSRYTTDSHIEAALQALETALATARV